MRVVSLLPSATELVCALGIEPVGVSFECDWPAGIRERAAVVVSGLDTTGLTPREIDDLVRARAGDGLYTLELGDLTPDLIVTQGLCEVCALPASQVPDVGAAVLSLDPHRLADVLDDVVRVGAATGRPEPARALRAALQRRLDAIEQPAVRRRTAVVEWVDPPYAAGHWVPDLVTAAGGEPTVPAGGRSVATAWPELLAGAEVVLVAPCGYDLDAACEQAASVPAGPYEVWAIDSGGLVVRPGPRLVDGVEAIHAALTGGRHDGVRRLR